ncbi:MAG TPA: TraB/GumN family protein, partial [Gammaproteobacteria bacterium]|nr:TraB/GumN family protein [Gammaproteobacteria bacterium]
RTRLVRLLMNYGFDRQTALKLKPWTAFTLLSRPKPTGAATLDQVLEETARQQGKPIKGLQPIEELVSALEGIPLAQQREIVLDIVCNRGLIERQERELVVRYLNQDLAGMLAVSRRYEPRDPAVTRTFEKRLLLDRNQRMLKRLQTYLKHGNAFVAVGALHLAGKKGLLSGLAACGYHVTPIHY